MWGQRGAAYNTTIPALDLTLSVPATMTLLDRYNRWGPAPLRRLHNRIGMPEAPALA